MRYVGSRPGEEIRSDNGTNFVAAEKELREELKRLREKGVHEFMLKEGITWVFNPPGASSHGGVWERQVRSIRKILSALLREQTMTDESLRTLLCEVESILNSTPITTVSSDPMDLQPLTPNDLLLLRGGPTPDGLFTTSLPETVGLFADGDKCNIWLTFSGDDGFGSTCRCSR